MKAQIHTKLEQGSPEWHDLRLGRVGGSNCSGLLVSKDRSGNWKDGPVLTLACNLLDDLERGYENFFSNEAMEHGLLYEPVAAEKYAQIHFCEPYKVGYVSLGDHFGVSPDRWIGKGKSIEIKCPLKKEFRRVLYTNEPTKSYIYKCYWEMFVTSFSENPINEIDLVYFHPEIDRLVTFKYFSDDETTKGYFERFEIGMEMFVKIFNQIK